MFNNITLIRYDADFATEIERLKVPITFASKEKYMSKISNENLTPTVREVYPRLSYELLGLHYDAPRKQSSIQRYATLDTANNSIVYAGYQASPYNLDFKLNVHARNIEDFAQIVEQILPMFQPDFTPTVDLLTYLKIPKDVRISLRGIDPVITYEGAMADETRDISGVLTFTMEAYFFGPVTSVPIIKKVYSNVYASPIVSTQIFNLSGTGSNGKYSLDDTVYQGFSPNDATAQAHVIRYENGPTFKRLIVDQVVGNFVVNVAVKSITTNANYILASFVDPPKPAFSFVVEPNPLTANANSDFGITFTTLNPW